MGAWPPRFLFISGRLCLDFAHTGGEGKFAKFERLRGPRDLVDWLAACSLRLPSAGASEVELREARVLRRAVWRGAQAVRTGQKPPRDVIAVLDRAARRPDLVPVLRGVERQWAKGSTARQALSTIARDAITLFGSEQRGRIRECRHPKCPLLFVDLSRPGRRAWCAMRRCGNMTKTCAYRKRRQASSAHRRKE